MNENKTNINCLSMIYLTPLKNNKIKYSYIPSIRILRLFKRLQLSVKISKIYAIIYIDD